MSQPTLLLYALSAELAECDKAHDSRPSFVSCPACFFEMLMGIIDASVRLLGNLPELVPILIQLGIRHNAYNVCIMLGLLVLLMPLPLLLLLTLKWVAIFADVPMDLEFRSVSTYRYKLSTRHQIRIGSRDVYFYARYMAVFRNVALGTICFSILPRRTLEWRPSSRVLACRGLTLQKYGSEGNHCCVAF